MKKGCYSEVHDRLEAILQRAGLPGADFPQLKREVENCDYGIKFPSYVPVSKAKFAVERCLSPSGYRKHSADAHHQLSSCRIADSEYFGDDGQLRAVSN